MGRAQLFKWVALCRVPSREELSVYEVHVLAWHHRVRMVPMGEKPRVRGTSWLHVLLAAQYLSWDVVRFAAERLRARPIGFSVRVSMVPLPAPGPLVPEARIIPLDQAADCRMFFLFIHRRGQIQRSIVVATCRTHRRHSHGASVITALGGTGWCS